MFDRDDSDSLSEVFFSFRRRRVLRLSSSENDTSVYQKTELKRRSRSRSTGANKIFDENKWFDPKGNQPSIVPFKRTSGAKTTNEKAQICTKAEEFYALFVTDKIFQHMSEQTNLYATLCTTISKRITKWTPTNKNELKRLFGLLIWMGIVNLPSLRLYWSQDPLFSHTFPRSVMSRDRFEILMRMLHFADNEAAVANNRLSKIQFVIDELNTNFQKYYDPPEVLCIDESLIPFRGRIVFRQGHTLCTDNWYTSIDLANRLIEKNTHLIGTFRTNLRENPNDVIRTNLKRGELISKENNQGITVLKWKEKRDVLVLSTKHSSEMINIKTKRGFCFKPKIIVDVWE
ncbi:piggyBac transposable element-derived protein 4-like [Polistes fuscatus]|uniref:piggyBac transposable element-derived protein 4-like n=1 Tax=Polistes fuscatus TaxID=30207 RepID=UPI001CAA1E55|nr:piggyBac transposable element-derived protein 4-like [Polistes fuscatus]